MKKLFLLLGLLLTLGAAELKAHSFYLGGFGGANWIQDAEHHFDFTYKTGYILGANLGYRFHCSGWRLEAEFSYRKNRIKQLKFNHFLNFSVHGHQRYYAGMGNVYYDFYFPNTWVTPFVGGGVGYYDENIKIYKGEFKDEHSESKIAWQVLGGISYQVNGCYWVVLMYRMLKPVQTFYNHTATIGVNYNF